MQRTLREKIFKISQSLANMLHNTGGITKQLKLHCISVFCYLVTAKSIKNNIDL